MRVVTHIRTLLATRAEDDRGASLVEYALLLALIAMVCIAAVTALGGTTSESFSEVTSMLE
ncbi:MAG: Flp family type IVb pilin [Acidimicrobiales bacterium]|nr:Flp family type IVb pilin [Acidimicrobiales bacterium]